MRLIRQLIAAILGRPAFTVSTPGFDPMEAEARKDSSGCGGPFFWIILAGIMLTAFMFMRDRNAKKKDAAELAVRQTEVAAYTATPTITTTPTLSPTPTIPAATFTPTATPTITGTPFTPTPTATATATPSPKIIYQDRTIVITVQVPWVITQIVKETVLVTVVVTATPSYTPSPTATPTITGTPFTSTPTPTETLTPTPTEIIY